LLGVVSASSSGPLDTLSIDLRHRWIALTAPGFPTSGVSADAAGRATPTIGLSVFREQEVEADKRQRSLERVRPAGVTWMRLTRRPTRGSCVARANASAWPIQRREWSWRPWHRP